MVNNCANYTKFARPSVPNPNCPLNRFGDFGVEPRQRLQLTPLYGVGSAPEQGLQAAALENFPKCYNFLVSKGTKVAIHI